jgi:hypothetical protein
MTLPKYSQPEQTTPTTYPQTDWQGLFFDSADAGKLKRIDDAGTVVSIEGISGTVGLDDGGTGADLSAGQGVLVQATSGANVSSLGGTGILKLASGAPSVAALTAGDITSGELSVARGGSGVSSLPNLSKRIDSSASITASPGWVIVPLDTSETGYANTGWTGSPDYKWTPDVAGFYLMTWLVVWTEINMTIDSRLIAAIRKNGTTAGMSRGLANTITYYGFSGAKILYMNGSTDYVQLVAFQDYSDPEYRGGEGYTYLNGMLLAGDDNI